MKLYNKITVIVTILMMMVIIPIITHAESTFTVPVVSSDMLSVIGEAPTGTQVDLYLGRDTSVEAIESITSVENNTYEFKRNFKVGEVYTVVLSVVVDEVQEVTKQIKTFTVIDEKKQKINAVTDQTNALIGLVNPKDKVKITYNNKNVFVNADDSGVYIHNLPSKFKGGEVISVFVDKNGSYSKITSTKVKDTTAPQINKVPVIYNNQTTIKGKTEANVAVLLYVNNKLYKKTTATKNGDFSFYSKLHKAGTKMTLLAEDASKNKSKKYNFVVKSKNKPTKKVLDVKLIKQLPELPRGCEVTSLAMMLSHANKNVSKMTLAKQIKRDKTPYKKVNGKVYFGNPYEGFVGDMYSYYTPGYGVYHGPIAELAEKYLPGRVEDLTGSSFQTTLDYVAAGKPVWVIINSWFNQLPSSQFQTWYTKQGPIRITMREHSVLVTGYDSKYVYVNDPLHSKNRKILKSNFIKAYNQMGKQAITYL